MTDKRVTIKRAGNAIALPADPAYTTLLTEQLTYTHRTYFQGPELRERQRRKNNGDPSVIVPAFEDEVRALHAVIDNEIVAVAGMTSRIYSVLTGMGYTVAVEDLRKLRRPPADFERLLRIPGFEFRYKVPEVLATIDSAPGGVIHLPTGMGKTMLMVAACAIYPTTRITIISPGVDLLTSTRKRLAECLNEQAGMIGGGEYAPDNRITLCSADSLHKLGLDKQGLVFYDEVHTAATPTRSTALASKFTEADMFGLSASVGQRADNADALVEALFGPVLISVPYEEAAEAGSVSQLRVLPVRVPEIPGFEARLPRDPAMRKRMAYTVNDVRNNTIGRATQASARFVGVDDPQILVMCETVEHIFELTPRLPGFQTVYANASEAIIARLVARGRLPVEFTPITPKDRQRFLVEFEQNRLRHVIANHCWKQGIDPRHLNVLVRADGGTSDINNTQIPGRLSRVVDGKPAGLLIDFLDGFSDWTKRRAEKRMKAYRALGFAILPPVAL